MKPTKEKNSGESKHMAAEKRKKIRVNPTVLRDSPNGVMAYSKPLYRCDDIGSVGGPNFSAGKS